MFILRRNKDNEVVAEQAHCPTPEAIVTATNNDMTWRSNNYKDTSDFMDATSAALLIMARSNKPMRQVTLRGPTNNVDVAIPIDVELETTIIKYCGEYYGNPIVPNSSKPVFHSVELYEIDLT